MTQIEYEKAVQSDMHDMAGKIGTLTAELRITRITLNSLIPYIDGWTQCEIAELVGRIDLALESRAPDLAQVVKS